jgi:hypothetical protein
MTSQHAPENPSPRPPRPRLWRTLLAGGAIAGVGLVAAHAGSLDFLRLELANLAKVTDAEPVVAQVKTGAHRSYSTAPEGRAPGMFVRAAQTSASAASTTIASIEGLDADEVQASSETKPDAIDLFELSAVAKPGPVAVSNGPLKVGQRFHGLIDGASSASQRPSYGGFGRRAQKGLAGCCDDPATQPSDALLTAPTLAAGLESPIPELSAWTLMILGFSLSGLVLRGERRRWA